VEGGGGMNTPIKFNWMTLLIIPSLCMVFLPFGTGWYGYVLFLVLALAFWRGMAQTAHREILIILQHLCVCLLMVFFSPWNCWYGIYPAIVTGHLSSFFRITAVNGFLVIIYTMTAMYYGGARLGNEDWAWVTVLVFLLGIPYFLRVQQLHYEMKVKLQGANEEIFRLVKLEERGRISRDLHDTLGHTLSLLTLKGELIERLIPEKPDEAVDEAKELQDIIRNTLMQTRKLVSDMQSVNLDDELLLASGMLRSAGLDVQVDELTDEVPPLIGKILGLCLRECATNVVKHSEANTCWIRIHETEESYILKVEDDGQGSENMDVEKGSGLFGMKERLSMIEGRLDFVSGKQPGVQVIITVPKVDVPVKG
jgi:two-component system, NarL family, sensor histidine kinase DesK